MWSLLKFLNALPLSPHQKLPVYSRVLPITFKITQKCPGSYKCSLGGALDLQTHIVFLSERLKVTRAKILGLMQSHKIRKWNRGFSIKKWSKSPFEFPGRNSQNRMVRNKAWHMPWKGQGSPDRTISGKLTVHRFGHLQNRQSMIMYGEYVWTQKCRIFNVITGQLFISSDSLYHWLLYWFHTRAFLDL